MEFKKTIRLKCAGRGQGFTVPTHLVTKCDLYICGIGGCDINQEYIIPEKKLHTNVIVAYADVKINGVQYRLPTKSDLIRTINSQEISILRESEKMQHSKLN